MSCAVTLSMCRKKLCCNTKADSRPLNEIFDFQVGVSGSVMVPTPSHRVRYENWCDLSERPTFYQHKETGRVKR